MRSPCFTNPLANFAVVMLHANFWLTEAGVCLVEIPLFRLLLQISWLRAVILSLLANALSGSLSFLLPGL